MTEDQAPRQNRDGHLCPPWCETDHDEVHGPARTYRFHSGPSASIEMPSNAIVPDRISARAFDLGRPDYEPVVSVSGYRPGTGGQDPQIWLGPDDAGDLAGLVDMLAAATPEQHRELAAAIRKAAADIMEAGQ